MNAPLPFAAGAPAHRLAVAAAGSLLAAALVAGSPALAAKPKAPPCGLPRYAARLASEAAAIGPDAVDGLPTWDAAELGPFEHEPGCEALVAEWLASGALDEQIAAATWTARHAEIVEDVAIHDGPIERLVYGIATVSTRMLRLPVDAALAQRWVDATDADTPAMVVYARAEQLGRAQRRDAGMTVLRRASPRLLDTAWGEAVAWSLWTRPPRPALTALELDYAWAAHGAGRSDEQATLVLALGRDPRYVEELRALATAADAPSRATTHAALAGVTTPDRAAILAAAKQANGASLHDVARLCAQPDALLALAALGPHPDLTMRGDFDDELIRCLAFADDTAGLVKLAPILARQDALFFHLREFITALSTLGDDAAADALVDFEREAARAGFSFHVREDVEEALRQLGGPKLKARLARLR